MNTNTNTVSGCAPAQNSAVTEHKCRACGGPIDHNGQAPSDFDDFSGEFDRNICVACNKAPRCTYCGDLLTIWELEEERLKGFEDYCLSCESALSPK